MRALVVLCALLAVAAAAKWNEKTKKEILDRHNEVRNSVKRTTDRSKKAFNKVPANMLKMRWDTALEETAQEVADRCPMNHIYPDTPNMWSVRMMHNNHAVGQNLAGYDVGKNDDNFDMVDFAFEGWYDMEKKWYNFNSHKCIVPTNKKGKPIGVCTHLTQLLWAESEFVGCAVKQGCERTDKKTGKPVEYSVIVCHYQQPGNKDMGRPFQKSENNKVTCPEGYKKDSEYQQLCASEICQVPRDTSCKDTVPQVECYRQVMEGECEATSERVARAFQECRATCGFCESDKEVTCTNKKNAGCKRQKTSKCKNNSFKYIQCPTKCKNEDGVTECSAMQEKFDVYKNRITDEFGVTSLPDFINDDGGIKAKGFDPCDE